MSKRYCVIYLPTGKVCEVENGICYDTYQSIEAAQASIDRIAEVCPNTIGNYMVAPLPRHLKAPPRDAYESKSFRRAVRRLRNGVPVFCKHITSPHKRGTFKVEYTGHSYRGAIILHTDFGDSFVNEVWEVPTLDWLRRIAVGYYPSIAKAIGPARQFAGV